MGGRSAVLVGVLAGMLAGAVFLAGAILLLPPPAAPPAPVETSSPGLDSPSPTGPAPATPSPGGDGAFHVGRPAPPLLVPQLGGGEIDLASLRGKPVWINFMATWCPPCRDELPRMNGFAIRYEDTGLVVIAIDVREEAGTVGPFVEEIPVLFPVGLDLDGEAQRTWGAYALPVHFWIDADGIVRDGALGGIGPDIMAAGLQSILPDVEVEP
jgi:cytochrome c biogenesis protein CcmG, thiol:disulfide interchange protein DsbE